MENELPTLNQEQDTMNAVMKENGYEKMELPVLQEAEMEAPDGIKKVRVAILSEDGFEQSELLSPKGALEAAGARVDVIAPHSGSIKGWNHTDWGEKVNVDVELADANVDNYDALVLPGGVMNPDKLRINKDAVAFVTHFISKGKPIAAICHGPQTLIETGMISGCTMTSFPSLQTDLTNAGVNWVDEEMVHFGQFITSRKPADLDAFNTELLKELALQ